MPRYEYTCPACDGVKILMRKIEERNDPVVCPFHMNAKYLMQRGFETAGFALRGGGWAKDGYASSK